MVTDEVAKEIGDDPEHVYAVRSAFLRDSELAAEWLAEQLAGPVVANDERQDGDAAGKPDGRDVIAATLDAVVKNGLAGVLQLAAGAKASDKVSATMLDMLTTDDNTDRYRWSAEKWVIELGQAGVRCSKKTIIGNRRQGIPPCEAWKTVLAWREANKADRVSSETAK